MCLDNLQTSNRSNLNALEGRTGFEFVRGDIIGELPVTIRDRAHRFKQIYNCACAVMPPHYQVHPQHMIITGMVTTSPRLQLASRAGAPFLLASTSETHGDPEMHPRREDYRGWVSCTGPRACQDEDKRAAEALACDLCRTARAEVHVARIFNTDEPDAGG